MAHVVHRIWTRGLRENSSWKADQDDTDNDHQQRKDGSGRY